MKDPRNPILRRIGLSGALFVGVEALCARVAPAPLDPDVPLQELLGAAGLLAASYAGLGALALWRWPKLGARAGLLPALLWALVWAFEGPRAGGLPLLLGGFPLLMVASVGWRWPRRLLLLSVLGAVWTPMLRLRLDGDPAGPKAATGPDILLITVDTVPADAELLLGVAGVEGGFQSWTQARSAAPWTLPALLSLWTGATVDQHGGGLPVQGGYTGTDSPRLAPAFQALGYETRAILSNPYLSPDNGFAVGFDRWGHADRSREALLLLHNLDGFVARARGQRPRRARGQDDRTLAAAERVLRAPRIGPRLLWVHLLSPHEYQRLPEGAALGAPPPEGSEDLRAAHGANVAATRTRIASLIAAAPGWTIAVTADHGEALGQEGRFGHGQRLWDPELRVPLALRVPGQPGSTIDAPVSTRDLLPALLQHAQTGGPVQLPVRESQRVGGLRRSADLAQWTADGGYQALPALIPTGPAASIQAESAEELRALGYLDPP